MAELNQEMIHRLTRLCRIDCSAEEQENLLKDLKEIVSYIEQLQEIDTKDVLPCNHILEGMANIMREDAVNTSLKRETFLANAPAHIGGMIRVPPVFKQS